MKKSKKTALILSGGGAKGAFQYGALNYLQNNGYQNGFDLIAGVSAGSLNGVMVAMKKFDELTANLGAS